MKLRFNLQKQIAIQNKCVLLMYMMLSSVLCKSQFQGTLGGGSSSGSLGSSSTLGSSTTLRNMNSHYIIQGKDNVFAKPITLSGQLSAQANTFGGSPGPPGPGIGGGTSDPDAVPIDGGLSVLVAAGVAYHVRKKKERKTENNRE